MEELQKLFLQQGIKIMKLREEQTKDTTLLNMLDKNPNVKYTNEIYSWNIQKI